MDAHQRVVVRAAAIVREQLARRQLAEANVYLPERCWALVVELSRKRDKARGRGWSRAVARITADLRWQLDYLRRQLGVVIEALDNNAQRQALPSQAVLCSEIAALSGEFEQLSFDLKRRQISVTTEPIQLNGQYLGPFQIQLNLRELETSPCYQVIALDPHPAGTNSSVTHPHVQDEHLCEGDGHLAIQAALAEGRLVDFFLIVTRLLMTYGEGKAYVELTDWDGQSCPDCGDTMSPSRSYSCEACETNVCGDCRDTCSGCQSDICRSCTSRCAKCDELFCDQCLSDCSQCQLACCGNCQRDGVCQACQSEPSSSGSQYEDETQDASIPAVPAAA